MAGAKKQRARVNSEPKTPIKPRTTGTPLIGSSCTWKQEELDRFLVEQSVIEVKAMIPDKFFEFREVAKYQSSNNPIHTLLTIARDEITSVQTDEIKNNGVVSEKAPHFNYTFQNLRQIRGLNVTHARRENLAAKRHEKRSYGQPTSGAFPVWVGPSPAPLSSEETQRIVSISDPAVSSAGSRLFTATQEHESETMAASFCQTALTMLFPNNPSVTWATGRDDGKPILEWRGRCDMAYNSLQNC